MLFATPAQLTTGLKYAFLISSNAADPNVFALKFTSTATVTGFDFIMKNPRSSSGSVTTSPPLFATYMVPMADVTSPSFLTGSGDVAVTVNLTGGTFASGPFTATDFILNGTNAAALAPGTAYTRTSATMVTISGLSLATATNYTDRVKAATQSAQATAVTGQSSAPISDEPLPPPAPAPAPDPVAVNVPPVSPSSGSEVAHSLPLKRPEVPGRPVAPGVVLVSDQLAREVPLVRATSPAGSSVKDAPIIQSGVGEIVRASVVGLGRSRLINVAVQKDGGWVKLGEVRTDAQGQLILPAISSSLAGDVVIRAKGPGGKTRYVIVRFS